MAAAYWASEFSLIRVLESEEWSGRESAEDTDGQLDIVVLHLSDSSTRRALNTATSLSARVHLVAPRVVPFALDLNTPQVPVSFTARQLREIADESQVDIAIDIILCRDLMPALSTVLRPKSLIVIGETNSPWWRFAWARRECWLAHRLRALGHQVVAANLC